MNILVVGGNTMNKGALLMLIAVIEQGHKYFSESTFVVPSSINDIEILEEYGYKTLDYPLYHVGSNKMFNMGITKPFITKIASSFSKNSKLVNIKGSVKIKDIDLVLDVSGYAFGNKFGINPITNLVTQIEYFKRRNVPYILLPQALGPFNEDLAIKAKAVINKANLIFARDKVSYKNISDLDKGAKNIFQCSDITLNLKSNKSLKPHLVAFKPYGCFVFNVRMLDKAHNSWKENYVEAMKKAIQKVLDESDNNIVLVVHSTTHGGDMKLTRQIFDSLKDKSRVKIEEDNDPLVLKKILKEATFLIGSRFHAIASALSSTTPTVATSWLHKYEMLCEEYQILNYCHNKFDDSFYKSIDLILDKDNNKNIRNILDKSNMKISSLNDSMWDRIIKEVN